jgi:glucose/arabinose dehydrogenase
VPRVSSVPVVALHDAFAHPGYDRAVTRPFAAPVATIGIGAVQVFLAACARPLPSGPSPSVDPSATAAASGVTATSTPGSEPTPSEAPPAGAWDRSLDLEPVVGGLDGPLDLAVRPGDPDALYVVEQVGRVRVVRDGALVAEPVLDIAGIVSAGGESGLLGLAFHPDPDDGRLFVYYTALDGDQVVSSFRLDPDVPDVALADEVMLLKMDDQFGNHNGGSLAFGPDGYLYIGTGDGGGGGDPLDSGRRLDTLLAKILRVDVDGGNPDGASYGIPADNPFLDEAGAMPEIWHTGLRNPWRIRFDRANGDLWIGDVGQGAWEEIDRAPAGVGGLDFGWNLMEGTRCYPSGEEACDLPGLTPPVTEYGHDEGCSVTGGTVYRGEAQPDLVGWYVLSDYCSGRFWVVDAAAAAEGFQDPLFAFDSRRNISAIAEDAAGELFATDLSGGEILRVVVAPE